MDYLEIGNGPTASHTTPPSPHSNSANPTRHYKMRLRARYVNPPLKQQNMLRRAVPVGVVEVDCFNGVEEPGQRSVASAG